MATDFAQELLNLLSNNWNSANTNSKTPKFVKITSQKRLDFRLNQDWVLAHVVQPDPEPAGISALARRINANVTLDVRVFGYDQESHFFNVIEEIDRILGENMNAGTSGSDVIQPEPEGETRTNLSDKFHDVWRLLIPVRMIDLVKAR